MVIGAASGEGKSTVITSLAAAIAGKGEWLGWKGSGDPVLILDFEQALEDAQQKLALAGGNKLDNLHWVLEPEGIDVALESTQDALEALFREHNYGVIIADPFYKMHRFSTVDEEAMRFVMNFWDRMRAKYQFSLVIPMHFRKENTSFKRGRTMDDILGSSILNYGSEVVLGWQRAITPPKKYPKLPGSSYLYFWKDRRNSLPVGTRWRIKFYSDGRFERALEEVKGGNASEAIRCLEDIAPEAMTVDEIMQHIGGSSPQNVATMMKRLCDDPSKYISRRKRADGVNEYFATAVPRAKLHDWRQGRTDIPWDEDEEEL